MSGYIESSLLHWLRIGQINVSATSDNSCQAMHYLLVYGESTVLTIINWQGRITTDVDRSIDVHSEILPFLSVNKARAYTHGER